LTIELEGKGSQKKTDGVYYQTESTTHLFMFDQCNDELCHQTNDISIATLHKLMCDHSRIHSFKLLDKFVESSLIVLEKYQYLQEWDVSFSIEVEEGGRELFPWESVRGDETNKEKITQLQVNKLEVTDEWDDMEYKLKGNVFTTKSEHIIQIYAPGVVETKAFNIRFCVRTNSVLVSVSLPPSFPQHENLFVIRRDFEFDPESHPNGKKLFFRHTFSDSQPFKQHPHSQELLTTLEGGIFTIHLIRVTHY